MRTSTSRHMQQSIGLARRQLHTQPQPFRPTVRLPSRQSLSQQLRHSSSELKTEVAASEIKGDARSAFTRIKNLFYGTSIVLAVTFTYLYVTDTRANIHQYLVVPTLRTLIPDAEDAHKVGNNALKALYTFGLHPRERGDPDAAGDLRVEVFGTVLDNPIGTSAGLDKNAEIPDPIYALGAGLVEVGGITPRPQEGNDKPRVWRIPSQNALINRYGLNSEGADSVAVRLRQRLRQFAASIGLGMDTEAERQVLDGEIGVPPGSQTPGRLLAVQIAKAKNTPDNDLDAIARDYTYCVEQIGRYADIVVVNVSSPNTPGLRNLQQSAPLTKILTAVVGAAKSTDRKTKPAVMVKVSPDEDSEDQVNGICSAVWASGVDGIIVGNTTKKRPDPLPKGYLLPSREEQIMLEMGGYSGPQMFDRTLALVKKYRSSLDQGPPASLLSAPSSSAPAEQKKEKKPEKDTEAAPPVSAPEPVDAETSSRIDASIARDLARLKPQTPAADSESSQPLLHIPDRHSTLPLSDSLTSLKPSISPSAQTTSGPSTHTNAVPKNSSPLETGIAASEVSAAAQQKEKVIFATGGITNGKQALEVLNAGASIAMVYTAVVYGGAGTITRIKREMREEIAKK